MSTSAHILERLGLQGLPEEVQVELLTKMTESVLKRIVAEVLELLSEDDRTRLFDLQEKGESDAIETFLKERIPNYDTLTETIVQEFIDEMQDSVAELKKNV